jgi:pimeloyl-ACP methyl ester carboxylesterase
MAQEFDIKLTRNTMLSCMWAGDKNGYPLIYLHGTPGSKREIEYLEGEAKKKGLKLIAFDRPGFGESEFYAYSPRSLCKDIEDMIAYCGIGKYSMIAYSAGAMYMIHHYQQTNNKPEFLFDIAGWVPVSLDERLYNALSAFDKFAIGNVKDLPKLTSIPEYLLNKAFATKEDDYELAKLLNKFSKLMGKTFDFGDKEFISFFASNVRYALGTTMEGAAHALGQLFGEPEFDPSGIEVPYTSWHGTSDDYVPYKFAEYKNEKIRDFRLNELEGEGHFQPFTHREEIIGDVAKTVSHTDR